MSMDAFDTLIPLDQISILLELGQEFHFDPLSSVEMEEYFVHLLAGFNANGCDMRNWLHPILQRSFRYASMPPRWIQNPQWVIDTHGPMVFLGQVDCEPIQGLFHDQASVYVFFDPASGERKTVLQIA